ncbi:MAG: glycosyltransferase [Limisphaerales bacterium]
MRWLIVEDSLADGKGHWFEYLAAFHRELPRLGDEVVWLVPQNAGSEVCNHFGARPVLPESAFRKMSDGAPAWRRYLRVPVHALRTYRAMKNYLRRGEKYDVIFIPTVLVHHLLGWTWLIKRVLKKSAARILLFFPNTPVQLDLKTNEPSWQPAPTAKLFRRLIRSLENEVKQGSVILGAETHPMREALTRLTGVSFTYFPHPVCCEKAATSHQVAGRRSQVSDSLTFGSYGSARHEKGSDILVAAVDEYCRRYPDSRAQFVLQSADGDAKLWERLRENPKVQLIPNYFADGEYARQLAMTDVLLLPYRRSSYGLRVSRVVIEAMVQGIPVVTTRGTTLEEQAKEFGAALLSEDNDVASLVTAIQQQEETFPIHRKQAEQQGMKARNHFCISMFRCILNETTSRFRKE